MDNKTKYYEKNKIIRHQLNDSIRTISGIVIELEEGYKFDDEDAKEIIIHLRKSINFIGSYFYKKGIIALNPITKEDLSR